MITDIRVSLIGDSAQAEAAFPGSTPKGSEHLGYTFCTATRDVNAYRFHFHTAVSDKPMSSYMKKKLSESQLFIFLANDRTGDMLADLFSNSMLKRPTIIVASPQEEAVIRETEGYIKCCNSGLTINVVSKGLFDESPIDLILNFTLEHVNGLQCFEIK